MPFPYPQAFGDGTPYPVIPAGTAAVPVANQAELDAKIAAAVPGQRLVLGAGTYSALSISGKNGTPTAGISIVAQSPGGPQFTGNSLITGCSYLTVSGLAWPQDMAGDTLKVKGAAHHVRVTRCTFGPAALPAAATTTEVGTYVYIGDDSRDIDVGYNEFANKARPGGAVRVWGNFTTFAACLRVRVHHNDIHDFAPSATGDYPPIMYGLSTMSRTDSYGVIERNVLTNIATEPELISGQTGALRITGNIARTCAGSMVVRYGRNCVVADNYCVDGATTTNTRGEKSGGYRFYDSGHLVERNYAGGLAGSGLQDPLVLDTGDTEGASTNLAGHWRVVGATVQGNVIVDCPAGVTIGNNFTLPPSGCTITGNVAVRVTTGLAVTQRVAPVATTIDATNLYYSTPAVGGFTQDSDGVWRKSGVGPRLTYLGRAAVGPAGDLAEVDGTGTVLSGSGGTVTPAGVFAVSAGPDVTVTPGMPIILAAVESGTGTVTARKWEVLGTPAGAPDPTVAADRFGWGAPLASSDEFAYTGGVDAARWAPVAVGNKDPARGTVNGAKLVATGLVNGQSFFMAHRFGQQYGRWECRMRSVQTGTTVGGGTGQTRGVGGVARPAAASNVELNGANRGDMNITVSGTATQPRIYDGGGFTCGRVTISADYIIVQNYNIRPRSQYGIYITGSHVTVQNCDVKDVMVSGDGDLNCITLLEGSDIKIAYNTAIDYVTGDPGASHTDFIQTWVSSSHPTAVSNVQVIGNKATGPANPGRNLSIASIHQIIMVESAGHGGNSGGSGTPSNWTVTDNEFGASWGQDVKLDSGNNFVFARNNWVGSSDRIFAIAGSGNVIYSDNTFGGGYGQVGATVTSGNGPGTTPGTPAAGGNYQPLLCVTPDSGLPVEDGAYYFSTNGAPGETSARAQMYFPRSPATTPGFREFTKTAVDWTQFHNIALEWTPTAVTGYVDGVQWFTTGGGATTTNRDIQTMPSGHLILGLENGSGTSMNPATMEVDWVRVYSLSSVGTAGGSGTGTISTAQSVTWTAGLAVGAYLLRYTATLSDTTTRTDDVTVTVSPSTPQTFFPTGIGSDEAFGATTAIFTGTPLPPTLTYPGPSTFPGPNTFPGSSRAAPGVPAALPGTFLPPGIPSEETFGSTTAFTVGVPPNTFAPPGIVSEETFGSTAAFTTAAEPAAAAGGVFVPSLWAVDKNTGAPIPLPKWQKITISRVRHNLGAITVDYPADAPGFTTLAASVAADPPKALEFRIWLGGNSTGALGGWLVGKAVGNKLVPGGLWSFTGHFHEWLMTKAIVGPQDKTAVNPHGEMVFAGATYGSVLLTVVQQAQLRKALPLVTCDFTASKDSNGQPWTEVVTNLRFPPKTTVMQVADKGVELLIGEYYMTGARVLRAFNPGTRGVDRSVGATPLTFAHTVNLREHSQRESARDAGTAVLAAGAEGFYAWGTNLTAEASLGFRAEVGVDGGNITSQTSVDNYAALQAQVVSKGVAEYTSGISFRPGDPLPLLGYDVGDVAVAVAGTSRTPSRIEQIDLAFTPREAPAGTVAQNSLVVDKLTALYRRLNALASGDAVVGTSTATPGGVGEDHTPPAAPTGLVVSSNIAYSLPGDATVFAEVSVGWLPVTTNAAGADIPIVQAAQLIYDHLNTGGAVLEDFSWVGDPPLVAQWCDDLALQYNAEHGTDPKTWLNNYLTLHSSTGSVTDDVDHYRIQFRYPGAVGVGFGGTSEGAGLRDPALPIVVGDAEFGWGEAPGSPTSATSLTFGEVVGGRNVGVRVAAVDRTGNRSAWSVELDFVAAVDNTPPPVASTPQVSAWFRTLNITWDGKGSQGEDMLAAAPDFLSGGGIEIHIGQGFNFTPHRPHTPDGHLDLAHSTTYVQTLYGPGTWNVPGLTIGVTYYARFVAFDNNGNAAEPSATSVGVKPEQLVNIDIGPNAVGRLQIIDGEIVRAKIADLAVNSAKIEEISAGLISAGTMVAQVAIGGMFYTPPTVNGNRVEFDAAGIRLYRGGTIVGRWQVADASVLVTGQTQTAITGQRIIMNPNGSNPDTIRFYPSFTNAYSSIDSVDWGNGQIAGIRIVGSANASIDNRGMLLIRDQFASLVHGRQDLTYWGSEIWVEQAFTRNKSAAVDLIIDERLTPVSGPRRVAMICYDVNGNPINATGLYYQKTAFGGGEPQFYANGQDVGLIFAASILKVRDNPNTAWRDIMASAFTVSSGRVLKRDIRDVEDDALTAVRRVKPKRYRWRTDPDTAPERMGFIADDLPYPVRVTHTSVPTDPGQPDEVTEAIDLGAALALLWGGVQKIDERLSAIEDDIRRSDTANG